MFYGVAASNQAIPAGGDTSDTAKVTDTAGLFNGASAFNKDISSWAVGSVTAHQQLQHVCQFSLEPDSLPHPSALHDHCHRQPRPEL